KNVWQASLRHQKFPPQNFTEWFELIGQLSIQDIIAFPFIFLNMKQLLKFFGLNDSRFIKMLEEQLLITAQNKLEQVNVLFGATALCYPLVTNYYLPGGMIGLAQLLRDYIHNKGGQVKTMAQ